MTKTAKIEIKKFKHVMDGAKVQLLVVDGVKTDWCFLYDRENPTPCFVTFRKFREDLDRQQCNEKIKNNTWGITNDGELEEAKKVNTFGIKVSKEFQSKGKPKPSTDTMNPKRKNNNE